MQIKNNKVWQGTDAMHLLTNCQQEANMRV